MPARQADHLVKMANHIALNLGAWGDDEAVARKTADHLAKFWTADMLAQLRDCQEGGKDDLSPTVRRALDLLAGQV